MKALSRLVVGVLLAVTLPSLGDASVITMGPVPMNRTTVVKQADLLVRNFARTAAQLTYGTRQRRAQAGRYNPRYEFSLPTVVRLQGSVPPAPAFKRLLTPGAALTLQFDASGSEAFPSAYQTLLQNTFNSAQSLLTTLFGPPSVGGTVHVANFDSTIGDRQAIAGGYYLPNNGSGVPEIRFPIYNADETAVVNFIHCLLLAYLGPDGYAWDGFEEGLVRAITMKVAQTPSALPAGLDQQVIVSVIQNSYDIGAEYDWSNQRPLSAPTFIAANLINSPLPPSGGGGPYLERYMMAGTAWAKLINEYPTFAAGLNAQVYGTPALGSNLGGLITAGQTVLNGLSGTPTVEGRTFADWFQHQYALNPTLIQGQKVLVQATPLTSTLVTGDFGVFIIDATYFSTDASGNETLLSATSYPIYWDDTFNEISTGNLEDQTIQIVASDGAVAPNLSDLYGGQPYRATVDVPVADKLQRVFLPSGAIATGANSTVNDFYGTVEGMLLNTGQTARVDVLIGGTVIASAPITNDAFGITIGATSGYNGYSTLTLNLVRTTSGTDSVVMTRVVDKTPGAIGVDLQVGAEGSYSYSLGLSGGISMIGLPVDAFSSDPGVIFGIPDADLLMARYDSSIANYALFPSTEAVTMGHAYFLNLPAGQNLFSVTGRFAPGVSTGVALKPGWNMISNPLREVIATGSVRVVNASNFPDTFTDAEGKTIGTAFFDFVPGTPDAASGFPETGTYVAGTEFDPGIGYFILCLAPEGVVLEFDADSALSLVTHAIPGYQLRVRATLEGHQTSAVIGETTGGSNTFSTRVDSTLPPAMVGGLQAYSVKGPMLYKDMRAMNVPHTFNVHVDGLTAGKNYVVDFSMLTGTVRNFMVIDTGTGRIRTLFPGSSWTIAARGTSDELIVVTSK